MSNHTPSPIISTSSASGSKPSPIDPGTAEPRGAFCPPDRDHIIALLRDLEACDEALAWIELTPGEPADLWAACQNSDWMLWLLAAIGYDERTMRHIACDCAARTLHIYEQVHPDDPRPRDCIAVARRHADGKATDDELIAAEDAALDAARCSIYIPAKTAAWAAAFTATCAASSAATWAASWAADSDAKSDADWDAAIARNADIIRARVSWADVERTIAAVGAQEALSK